MVFKHSEQSLPPPPTVAPSQSPGHAQEDFTPPQDAFFAALEAAASRSSSNAFLSWLADQLSDAASRDRLLDEDSSFSESQSQEFIDDPYVDGEFSDISQEDAHSSDTRLLDFSVGLEASYDPLRDEPHSYVDNPYSRVRWNPLVETAPGGGRCETFAAGSKIIKDVLGRVVEVHSQFGDCLYFRYGVLGNLEHFERTDAHGYTHSEGRKDKHGVVVRDHEGRVRAAGETMAVDPRGCFYVHTFDGQYMSLDLVTGIHAERRKVKDSMTGTSFVITSLFAHDGFRMATVFSGMVPSALVASGRSTDRYSVCVQELRFRFYGRDGTLIEFASEDELKRLQPLTVTAPASRKVSRTWQNKRQAGTAWDSVHEYLMRVS